MKNLYGNDKKHEDARRRRALHTMMGNDLCTTLLKSRIRLQKLLNEMNTWSVREDPMDESRQGVLAEAMAALSLVQGLPPPPSVVSAASVAAAERRLAAQHVEKMAAWRSALEEQHHRTALLTAGAAQKGVQSPVEALDRTLADRRRLQARTHISRTGVKPADAEVEASSVAGTTMIDEDEAVIWAAEQERERKKKGDRVVCIEVFDDSDFYEQLLHDFIRSRGADKEGPAAGKKWSDLHQLRSKLKIVACDRASKGRKIRYTVCPKMVNIAAPKLTVIPAEMLAARVMNDNERENLYRSLFR